MLIKRDRKHNIAIFENINKAINYDKIAKKHHENEIKYDGSRNAQVKISIRNEYIHFYYIMAVNKH